MCDPCQCMILGVVDECSWRKAEVKGDVPAPRSGATLSAVGQSLFLFGGLSRNSGWFSDVHVFDIGTVSSVKTILCCV